MGVLITIKRLSENYKVPINLLSDPTGNMKLYVDNNLVSFITIDEYTSEDYVCDRIQKFVEKFFRR